MRVSERYLHCLRCPFVASYQGPLTKVSLTSGALNWLDFPIKVNDTLHNVVGAGSGVQSKSGQGWRFVVPVAGVYHVSARLQLQNSSPSTTVFPSGVLAYIQLVKNGVLGDTLCDTHSAGQSGFMDLNGDASLALRPGDFLELACETPSGAFTSSYQPGNVWIEIAML